MPSIEDRLLASVGANVRQARIESERTQGQLAEDADVDTTYIQRIERGKANLTLRTLCRLARALKVEPFELLKPARAMRRKQGRPLAANKNNKKEKK